MQHIPLPLKLAFAWLWVAVPLGWGLCQSAIKSAPLFGLGDETPIEESATRDSDLKK